jgi:glycosyltransferase involved in cell wall biosynthesis
MDEKNRNALFVSYNAITEPIVRSQVLPYLTALSAKGFKFSLLTFEKIASPGTDAGAELREGGIDWVRRKFHSRPAIFAKPRDIITGFFAVMSVCRRRDIRIVHSRGIMAAAMSILPAKAAKAHFIFDMKSSLAEAYRISGRIDKNSPSYWLLSFLERSCALAADEVIVETNTHKMELEGMARKRGRAPKITVLPCCVETERFAPALLHLDLSSREKMRLVYLGSLSGWYMVGEMLDFFKELRVRAPEAELLFLTDDKNGKLADLVRARGVEGVTIMKVPYKDVPARLCDATAGLLFKYPNERLDSFPIKVGEYLAAGLPLVINTGMGDVEELVREYRVGVVVGSCHKAGYSEAVVELEKLLTERNGLRERCVDVASRQLSLSRGIAEYENIYKRATR